MAVKRYSILTCNVTCCTGCSLYLWHHYMLLLLLLLLLLL